MKQIPLTQNKITIVDDEDFDRLDMYKWYFNNGYAVRGVWNSSLRRMEMILMHREILKTPKDLETDHINLDRLDNRRKNLRVATASTNQANRVLKNNTSGYKGVHWKKNRQKWEVSIMVKQKYIYLGSYIKIKEAAQAYNQAAKQYFGEFAYLNKL